MKRAPITRPANNMDIRCIFVSPRFSDPYDLLHKHYIMRPRGEQSTKRPGASAPGAKSAGPHMLLINI